MWECATTLIHHPDPIIFQKVQEEIRRAAGRP
jgi:hypothetical protein